MDNLKLRYRRIVRTELIHFVVFVLIAILAFISRFARIPESVLLFIIIAMLLAVLSTEGEFLRFFYAIEAEILHRYESHNSLRNFNFKDEISKRNRVMYYGGGGILFVTILGYIASIERNLLIELIVLSFLCSIFTVDIQTRRAVNAFVKAYNMAVAGGVGIIQGIEVDFMHLFLSGVAGCLFVVFLGGYTGQGTLRSIVYLVSVFLVCFKGIQVLKIRNVIRMMLGQDDESR